MTNDHEVAYVRMSESIYAYLETYDPDGLVPGVIETRAEEIIDELVSFTYVVLEEVSRA